MTEPEHDDEAVELTGLTAVTHEITEDGVTTHRQPFAGTITIRPSKEND